MKGDLDEGGEGKWGFTEKKREKSEKQGQTRIIEGGQI